MRSFLKTSFFRKQPAITGNAGNIDTSAVESAIATMHGKLQSQIDNLGGRVENIGGR